MKHPEKQAGPRGVVAIALMRKPMTRTSLSSRPATAFTNRSLRIALCGLVCGALPLAADSFAYVGATSQSYTASVTGVYDIVAYGAGGGTSEGGYGGLGAEIGAFFDLTAGEVLTIDVGGMGGNFVFGGGGGGGSFVVASANSNVTPLVIAGGGGSGGSGYGPSPGQNAQTGSLGGTTLGAGGSNGLGGAGGSNLGGGGGAGFSGNGGSAPGGGSGGLDYSNGLLGGSGVETDGVSVESGGFGGGGGGNIGAGGGGGGYSGGGGGGQQSGGGNGQGGGGGGSYLDASAFDTTLVAGAESGNGMVTITLESSSSVPEPGSLTLFGLALLGFPAYRQWRKRSRLARS